MQSVVSIVFRLRPHRPRRPHKALELLRRRSRIAIGAALNDRVLTRAGRSFSGGRNQYKYMG